MGGLLRQQLAAPHHRLQLGRRGGRDEERRLAAALAGRANRLGLIGRVVHVAARLELGVIDAEQRAQQPLVQDRDGQRAPRRRGAGRPGDRGRRLGRSVSVAASARLGVVAGAEAATLTLRPEAAGLDRLAGRHVGGRGAGWPSRSCTRGCCARCSASTTPGRGGQPRGLHGRSGRGDRGPVPGGVPHRPHDAGGVAGRRARRRALAAEVHPLLSEACSKRSAAFRCAGGGGPRRRGVRAQSARGERIGRQGESERW